MLASPMANHTIDDPFTGETACSVPIADDAAISRTLDQAREAARALRGVSVDERIAICDRALTAFEARAEEIAREITKQMGKPLSQSRGEVMGMAGRWRHMQEIAKASLADVVLPPKDGFERRIAKEPLGVVLDLPAWNYPLLTAVNAVIPAVLAGNAVVVKHSPRTPLCGEHFARAFESSGGPANVVQWLFVDYETTEKIVGDARVDHVLFTGSVLGGHRIQAAARDRFMHVGLELGGNDPAYVAADADLDKTVENVVDGAIYNAGQSCCAVERVYVHASMYEKFLAAAEPLVRAYAIGDPTSDATTLGPIAQPWHVKELSDFIADAKAKGAKVIAGGEPASVSGKGRFFQATLLRDVPQGAALMQKESFGPILAVAPVASDEEALARMNDSRLGLTASVWTADRDRADRLARQLDYGTVYMNRCDALDPALPWTGAKDSGRGVTLSALGFDALTRPKAIHFRLRF
ncbi:MAG: aldehyde dehydrogenase family protein [Labilithrix sp.]|nr:aldehyde dehydrogenase family protein [Labilithrix sp.]